MFLRETDMNTYRYTYVHRYEYHILNLLSCLLSWSSFILTQAISHEFPVFLLPILHIKYLFFILSYSPTKKFFYVCIICNYTMYLNVFESNLGFSNYNLCDGQPFFFINKDLLEYIILILYTIYD